MSPSDPPTLAIIALDLQIKICTFLRPSDILVLRKTCKVLYLATRQRILWISILLQVCIDNTLFLPSFPIPKMSDVELEQAAMAPCRWIRLCDVFVKGLVNNAGAMLSPATKRNFQLPTCQTKAIPQSFLVPGGRYLVIASSYGIAVWDLGYASDADCKVLDSVGHKDGPYSCEVSATSDGMGLIIVVRTQRDDTYQHYTWFVYEIYPTSETPQLTEIARIDYDRPVRPWCFLLPDRVVWYDLYDDNIVFVVWDYRLKHSTSFTARIVSGFELKVIATTTTLIVLSEEAIVIWAIPPLSPQPLDFCDHNPIHVPPLFRIPFPPLERENQFVDWEPISSWYFGSSQPLYFNVLCQDYKLRGFELVIKPDLSDASLHVTNIFQLSASDFVENIKFGNYRVCDNTLVSWWGDGTSDNNQCTVSVSSGPLTAISSRGCNTLQVSLPGVGHVSSSFCPASGRFVYPYRNGNHKMVVVDFLP